MDTNLAPSSLLPLDRKGGRTQRIQRPADCQSAKQQVGNLRYFRSAVKYLDGHKPCTFLAAAFRSEGRSHAKNSAASRLPIGETAGWQPALLSFSREISGWTQTLHLPRCCL